MENILSNITARLNENPEGFIKECEEQYHEQIRSAAQRIAEDDDIRIVAVSGPSAAGKTTTAQLLCSQLELLGEVTAVVSLDDFYLPSDRLPLLPDGSYDLETVNSLDIPLIKKCFEEIIASGKTILPTYDFVTDSRTCCAKTLDIGSRGIVVVEGLHALNPVITSLVPRKNIFNVYISVNRSVTDEAGNILLTSRQLRLIRRTLRDETFRGSPVEETLSLWSGVVANEEKYLYCFKPETDAALVTFHSFEPSLYRDRFCEIAETVTADMPNGEYFLKTAEALSRFNSIDRRLVPKNSLIREFIGQDVE